ncbi:hypothetical protein [Shewanella sp. NIFS-20-20]|uniref:hypothetical protein n=1 Tax=Shewanella sp. NIFS-20-20 TaxID=2853806 RepID=UPI001C491396|nr:hypothetical protein [Shewanella sp. NIFS-20-20]MBV7314305.1 hypothetical protein [Shewanella sp. NIFS-20-20]
MNIIQLKNNIHIEPYSRHSSRESNEYLVRVGPGHFVVSQPLKYLIEALQQSPATLEQLSDAFYILSGVKQQGLALHAIAKQHIPKALWLGEADPQEKHPLMFNLGLLSPRQVLRLTNKLLWLFSPMIVVGALLAFCLLHSVVLWQLLTDGVGAWQQTQPVALIAIILLCFLWHELGHASANRKFGGTPGRIGVGLYVIFPAFYADVTTSWQLTRMQRVVVDVSGLYFQAIALIFIDLYQLYSHSATALNIAWLITFAMLYTLNPFFKFDGYWLLSDLSGITNLHQKMRQTVRDLIHPLLHGRRPILPANDQYLLLAYSLLSLAFFSFFVVFLSQQLSHIVATLPAECRLWYHSVTTFQGAGDYLYAAWQLVTIVFWPAVLLLGLSFYLMKFIGFIYHGLFSSPKELADDNH